MDWQLITVGKSAHAAHDTKHVVVRGIHTHRGRGGRANSVVRDSHQESGVINTRQVARAAGLVLLGLESKRVHVDTRGRHVGVVLEGLHLVEIASLATLEPVVAVQLQKGVHGGVLAGKTLHASQRVPRLQDGAVPPIGVVEGLLALPGVDHVVIARHERITLDNPDEFLARVVKVQLQLVGGGRDRLTTRELQGLDEVLVGHLGELATLIRVKVDVVHVEGGSDQASSGHAVTDGVGVGQSGGLVPAEVPQVVELKVDTHLVVLEGDQRQSKTRVSIKPELERNVQSVLRGAAKSLRGGIGLTARASIVAVLTALHQQVHEFRHVANHLGIASLLSRLLGEFIPDLEPVTIVFVDTLTANLEFHTLHQVVTHPVQPAELGARAIRGQKSHLRQSGLKVDAVDQITITLDRASHLAAKARRTVERVLNGLHGKVRVSAVHHLEKSDLRVTRQIHILSTVCNQLH